MTLQPIHDTIQVTKVVVDTLRGSSKDSLDLLTKLDLFYNNSWSRLITVVTISFAVVGLLVPFLIQWYQRRELKLSEEKLKEEIKAEIKTVTTTLHEAFLLRIENAEKELKGYIDKQLELTHDILSAKTLHYQAINYMGNQPTITVFHAVSALYYYIKSNDYTNSHKAIWLAKTVLPNCSKENVDKAFESASSKFLIQIEQIKVIDANTDKSLEGELKELENLYLNLT